MTPVRQASWAVFGDLTAAPELLRTKVVLGVGQAEASTVGDDLFLQAVQPVRQAGERREPSRSRPLTDIFSESSPRRAD